MLKASNAAVIATVIVATLFACGGKTVTGDESSTRSGVNAGANGGAGGGGAAPTPTVIPSGPERPPGAVGRTPCSPLDQPAPKVIKPTAPVIVGQTWNTMVYVIDTDPERPGFHRAFIQRSLTLERHALSEDAATPDKFIIDRGLPNQIIITKTAAEITIQGAGEDGTLTSANSELLSILKTYSNDSPESLAYAPSPPAYDPDAKSFYVVAPVANGVVGVPRVFYGPINKIEERTFLGFTPSDSAATATAATSVTFDLDGTPTTLPTVVKRESKASSTASPPAAYRSSASDSAQFFLDGGGGGGVRDFEERWHWLRMTSRVQKLLRVAPPLMKSTSRSVGNAASISAMPMSAMRHETRRRFANRTPAATATAIAITTPTRPTIPLIVGSLRTSSTRHS